MITASFEGLEDGESDASCLFSEELCCCELSFKIVIIGRIKGIKEATTTTDFRVVIEQLDVSDSLCIPTMSR